MRIPHIKKIKKLAATKSRHLSTKEVETDCPSAKENGQMFLIDIQTFVLTIALDVNFPVDTFIGNLIEYTKGDVEKQRTGFHCR